jgi:uncharacterized protein with HEPN domain
LKGPPLYLIHIRDCCEKIIEYSSASDGDWMTNKMATDAICRNLEIIGEAANKLGEEFLAAHPGIPWRGMMMPETSLSMLTTRSTLFCSKT